MPAAPTDENELLLPGGSHHGTALARTGNSTVRKFKVPWDQWPDYVTAYLGDTQTFVSGGRRQLRRWTPYAEYRGSGQYAVRATLQGIAYRGQRPSAAVLATPGVRPLLSETRYQWAIVTVYFESVRWAFGLPDSSAAANAAGSYTQELQPTFESARWCYKDVRPGTEFLTYKPGLFLYQRPGDGQRVQIPFPIGTRLQYQDVIVTWKDIPIEAFPATAIDACVGSVNRYPVQLPPEPPPAVYEPETLYLDTWEPIWTWLPRGDRAVDVRYYFKRRKIPGPTAGPVESYGGWNHEPFADGTFRRVYRNETDDMGIFAKTDFSTLFQPEP